MTRKALVVGIHSYPNFRGKGQRHDLAHAPKDAEAIARFLRDYGRFEVTLLPENGADGIYQVHEKGLVMAKTLKNAIHELFVKPQNDKIPQTALLFFAGHGLAVEDCDETIGYLGTSDNNSEQDKWGIEFKWLATQLAKSSVSEQIIWLDCCNSGNLLTQQIFEKTNPSKPEDRKRSIIAACRDSETAHGLDGHGVLTHLLKRALDPERYGVGCCINSSEVEAAIEREFQAHEQFKTYPQRPVFFHCGRPIQFWEGRSTSYINLQKPKEENEIKGKLIPDKRCRILWGRETFVNEIINYLKSPEELSILYLSGSAGYGKTEAAKAIARATLEQEIFTDVLWVTARDTELVDTTISKSQRSYSLTWNKFVEEIAIQIGCPHSENSIQQHLREKPRLIVLDNAETSEYGDILAKVAKILNPSRMLLTSRVKIHPQFVKSLPIIGLDEFWSQKLLREEANYKKIPILMQATEQQIYRIHQLSCGAPLALHFVVGLVEYQDAIDPVLSALEEASGEVEVFYQFTLETAWQAISEESKRLLHILSQKTAGITQSEISEGWRLLELPKAKKELKQWYLIAETTDITQEKRYDLHPWVRASVRQGLVEKWQPSLKEQEHLSRWKYGLNYD